MTATASWTYRLEYVRCGKANCHCRSGIGHGPYWYRYQRDGKRIRKEYVGKVRLGPDYDEPHRWEPDPEPPKENRWHWNNRRMDLTTALRIFGFDRPKDQASYKTRYRSLMKEHHPDAGGTHEVCSAINAAWEYLSRS